MVINGAIVSDLDMMYLESVLQEEQSLSMMMRKVQFNYMDGDVKLKNFLSVSSSRTEPPDLAGIMRVTDDMIDSLVCPPPPTDPPVMSEEMISGLIVPAPGWNKQFRVVGPVIQNVKAASINECGFFAFENVASESNFHVCL
uniref:Uncharacterized protein n=1 Tax=Glossina morsitans morsitans TaxID=37546 RepID=A0A1B0G7G9_GLOMM